MVPGLSQTRGRPAVMIRSLRPRIAHWRTSRQCHPPAPGTFVAWFAVILVAIGVPAGVAVGSPAPPHPPAPVVHSERPAGLPQGDPHNPADLRAIEARIEPII